MVRSMLGRVCWPPWEWGAEENMGAPSPTVGVPCWEHSMGLAGRSLVLLWLSGLHPCSACPERPLEGRFYLFNFLASVF